MKRIGFLYEQTYGMENLKEMLAKRVLLQEETRKCHCCTKPYETYGRSITEILTR